MTLFTEGLILGWQWALLIAGFLIGFFVVSLGLYCLIGWFFASVAWLWRKTFGAGADDWHREPPEHKK